MIDRRAVGVAVVAGVLACGLPAPAANARTYAVWSCRGPAGEPVSAQAWARQTVNAQPGDVAFADTCAQGGALRVSLAGGRAFDSSVVGMATFSAPPGTRIVGYELWRSLTVAPPRLLADYDYAAAVAETAGGASASYGCATTSACHSAGDPDDPLAAVNRVDAHGQPLDAVGLQVACEWAWCPQPSGTPARADLYRAQVLVDDSTPPAAPVMSGDLTAGGAISATTALTVSSSDQGAGIAAVSMSVDGGAPRTVASAAPGCREPYVAAPPCPTAAAQSFTIDAAALAAGRHSASGTVVDAAGNATAWGRVDFTVAHAQPAPTAPGPGPSAPRVVAAATAHDRPVVPKPKLRLSARSIHQRVGAPAQVKGTLRSAAGAPLRGVRLTVTELALGVGGARPRRLAPVTTDARGRFTVTVRGGGARRVRVAFAPGPGEQPTAVASTTVRTHLALAARPTPSALVKGRVLTVSGRLRGAGASARGAIVRIESIVDRRWAPVGVARVRADGRYRWRYRFVHLTRDTTFSFRAVVARTPGWPWASVRSKRFLVDVDVP